MRRTVCILKYALIRICMVTRISNFGWTNEPTVFDYTFICTALIVKRYKLMKGKLFIMNEMTLTEEMRNTIRLLGEQMKADIRTKKVEAAMEAIMKYSKETLGFTVCEMTRT